MSSFDEQQEEEDPYGTFVCVCVRARTCGLVDFGWIFWSEINSSGWIPELIFLGLSQLSHCLKKIRFWYQQFY